MNNKLIIIALSLQTCTFPCITCNAQKSEKKTGNPDTRPNIVIMIADDCTYRDLGCYGSLNSITPNIDKLASQGIRFDNFFQAAPMSSPTRHCLMTGLYPVKNGAYPNHAFVKQGTRSVVHHMKSEGYRVALQGKRHIAPKEVFPYEYLSGGNADVDTSKIQPFIKNALSKKEPFCLFICSHQPHTPWNKGDVSKFNPDSLILPSYYADTQETRKALCRYYAEINYMDKQVGAVLQLLEKNDIADNTVFFFTSEQGNSLPFAKWTCYDMGLQTGMIIRWPGVITPGSTSKAIAEYVDITPTIVEIAGGIPDKEMDGKSFLKLLTGKRKRFKKFSFGIQTSRGTINGPEHYGIRSVRTGRYIYIRNLSPESTFQCASTSRTDTVWSSWKEKAKKDPRTRELVRKYQHRPYEELYDRINDPDQEHNLAGMKKYRKIQTCLSKKLDKWMESQGDLGLKTEMEAEKHQIRAIEISKK